MLRPALLIFTMVTMLSTTGRAQQFILRQYTAVDGLPQSQVNAIVEDPMGYLWIGTSGGGLARFDGREFKVYSTLDGLLSNVVSSLFIDSHQNVWMIHPRGLTRFDGITFKKFQSTVSSGGLKRIKRMVEFHDTIFMVSNPGMIGKIYNDSVYYWSRKILPGKSIFFTHVATNGKICYYLSDSSFVVPAEKGHLRFPHGRVFGKAYNMFNHGNEVWLDTDSGTFAIDLEKGSFSRRTKIVDRYVICYDPGMDHYWTRDERTLFREYVGNGTLRTDTVLKDVPIIQVHVDAEGNTWLGSAGKGLYRYYSTDFIRSELGSVMAVEKDKEGTWIGGRKLTYFKNGKSVTFPLPNGDDDGVHAIRKGNDGTIWVGSYSALGRYSPGQKEFKWFNRQDGMTSAYITNLDFDEKGGLWIGTTGGGLNYYDGKKFNAFDESKGLASHNITSLRYMPRTKSLYIGTELGLQQWKDGSITSIPLPEFENTSVLSLAIMRDTLLLAGSGGAGLAILAPRQGIKKLIGPREGLPSGFVFFVATDETDRIWVGTEKGITRMKLDDHLEIMETRDFGFDNGLTGIETNQNAYFLSPQEKYFGLIDGLYQYHESEKLKFKSYPVHLTDIQIRYGEIPIRPFGKGLSGFFKVPTSLELSSDDNHITFTFNRVDKRYPKSVRYKYFLRNFDNTWSQPSAQGRVTYSNLPPGDYVFQVTATDNQGSWDSAPLEYAFAIKAPFYQTSAFYLIMGGLFSGSLALFILVRMRRNISNAIAREHIRQQEQEALRKEIARDFHDEMGNQLTRIINYVSLLRLNGNGQGTDLFQKVEDSAKYLYNGTRDFIWAIDPVNDDLGKLFLHIRDFGEKLFEEKNIRFRAYNEVKGKVKLPYGFSREANLIFKEAMTNAFKHSGAVNVSFLLKQHEGLFELILEDDGKGFDPTIESGHNGLKNIRSRAEKIQSSLVIERIPDTQGTRVILRLNNIKIKTYDPGDQKTRTHR